MPDKHSITIQIDPAQLAALAPSSDPSPLLREIAALLADVRERLDADQAILVDEERAGKMLGVCGKSLKNWGVPHVRLGTRRLYRVAALEEFAKQQERGAA
jgi:hypothetical protein